MVPLLSPLWQTHQKCPKPSRIAARPGDLPLALMAPSTFGGVIAADLVNEHERPVHARIVRVVCCDRLFGFLQWTRAEARCLFAWPKSYYRVERGISYCIAGMPLADVEEKLYGEQGR